MTRAAMDYYRTRIWHYEHLLLRGFPVYKTIRTLKIRLLDVTKSVQGTVHYLERPNIRTEEKDHGSDGSR